MDWTFMPFVIWRVPTIMEGEIFIQWVEDPLFNDNEVVHRVLSFPWNTKAWCPSIIFRSHRFARAGSIPRKPTAVQSMVMA